MLALAAERYLEAEDLARSQTNRFIASSERSENYGAQNLFCARRFIVRNSAYLPALFQSVNESLPAASYYITRLFGRFNHAENGCKKKSGKIRNC
jgi:hypothetical protein